MEAQDQAGAVADDGRAEDLRGAQDRAVGGALVEARLLDQLALGVQQQDAHLFHVQVGQVEHHQVRRVRRGADLVLGVYVHQAKPAPDLQGRLDLGRPGLPHAVLGAQLAAGQGVPHIREELVGQFEGVIAAGAGAQDDRKQFGHGERLGAEVLRRSRGALRCSPTAAW